MRIPLEGDALSHGVLKPFVVVDVVRDGALFDTVSAHEVALLPLSSCTLRRALQPERRPPREEHTLLAVASVTISKPRCSLSFLLKLIPRAVQGKALKCSKARRSGGWRLGEGCAAAHVESVLSCVCSASFAQQLLCRQVNHFCAAEAEWFDRPFRRSAALCLRAWRKQAHHRGYSALTDGLATSPSPRRWHRAATQGLVGAALNTFEFKQVEHVHFVVPSERVATRGGTGHAMCAILGLLTAPTGTSTKASQTLTIEVLCG